MRQRNIAVMYPRKRTARRRWLLMTSIVLVVIILALGWWQRAARQAGAYSPAERLLQEILSPSTRLAAFTRNAILPDDDSMLQSSEQLPRVGMARLSALEEENRQLRALLKLRDALPAEAIAAEVIGRNINPWQGNLQLGAGTGEGVTPHMVALTPDGVLGQIIAVSSRQSEALLLTDRASSIGGMIARTRETGVLKGLHSGQCQLVYLSDHSDVRAGDEIVTSGLSDYFPRGLPLGSVVAVNHDAALSSRTAIVVPAVNPSRVERVLLTK